MAVARWRREILAGGLVVVGLVPGTWGAAPVLAQEPACQRDAEPDDHEADLPAAPAAVGAFCQDGTLGPDDQDLLLWEVPPDGEGRRWSVLLDGVGGTLTTLAFFRVESEPGVTPLVAGPRIAGIEWPVDATDPVGLPDLLLPAGRILVGISRSALPGGGEPTDQGYRIAVSAGAPLPAPVEREPNDRPDDATRLAGAFSVSGDGAGSLDQYRWEVPDAAEPVAWELRAQGLVGERLTLQLQAPDGTTLAEASADDEGRLGMPDLLLPAGRYRLLVSGAGSDDRAPYLLEAASGPVVADAEPNDRDDHAAIAVLDGPPVRGRIGTRDDRDRFRIVVPPGDPVLRDIRLLWQPGPSRELCLSVVDGPQLVCRTGESGVALPDVLLPEGEVIVSVNGLGETGDYLLRLDATTPPAPNRETEPNEHAAFATAFDPALVMQGLGGRDDLDTYRIVTTGEPQLWELRATGQALTGLELLTGDERLLARGDVADDGSSAQLTDVLLPPGRHVVRVRAADGPYTLHATPLGPPGPGAEREPNNDAILAEILRVGEERTGRIPDREDVDVLRFTLGADDHVRLSVEPPPDGAIGFDLDGNGRQVHVVAGDPGEAVSYDAALPPGDYQLRLDADVPSRERYRILLERADPFAIAADQEPNDDPATARPLPADGRVAGTGRRPSDVDVFALGPSPDGAPVRFELEGSRSEARLGDGETEIPLTQEAEGGAWASGPTPADRPLYLSVRTSGAEPYSLRVLGRDGPAPGRQAPVEVALAAPGSTVAAYWPEAQRLTATLRVSGTGPRPATLHLDARTSDAGWSAVPQATELTVPAGGSAEVPLDILVAPDARADDPVRVTVRVTDADGATRTAALDLHADRTVAPVGPWRMPPYPEAFVGGLDVAASALGAAVVDAADADLEAELHDGTAHVGTGWYRSAGSWELPLELTVDLAGDAPVPVAGTILDPRAMDAVAAAAPRAFTLLLSTDGSTWTPVLEAELSTRMAEQAFALAEPVPARFARLRIDSAWSRPGDGRIALGEWSVIAAPGVAPSDGPIDLAPPAAGGHIAWFAPQQGDPGIGASMLDPDPTAQELVLRRGSRPAWVVGFWRDRAAQVARLEWQDAPGGDPKLRVHRVELAASLEGPAGPWTSLGTWTLERRADGTVAPFVLDEPVWARFLRFTGDGPKQDTYHWRLPAAVRILERPTDGGYRSILGAWGSAGSDGPFEAATAPAPLAIPAEDADDDSPERARPLAPDRPAEGRVDRGVDVDWYRVTVPADHDSLTLGLTGAPFLGAGVVLIDAEGLEVPMLAGPGADARSRRFTAQVDPGATYLVRVEQPVTSVVLAFDTSASAYPYLGAIYEAMRSFVADIVPGEEAVRIVPFEEPSLLEGWSDDRYALADAVRNYVPFGLSSGAEAALLDAGTDLAARPGARAVLLLTDGETSTFARTVELWSALEGVRPLVFAAQVGASERPLAAEQVLQDWVAASGGVHRYATSNAELDIAFDRLATWLRRPAAYRLELSTAHLDEPPPSRKEGTIAVAPPTGTQGRALAAIGSDVGVEIILDTSGSMLERIGRTTRIAVARAALGQLLDQLPAGTPTALRVFGDAQEPCATRLAVPLGPVDRERTMRLVTGLPVEQRTDTPIGAALAQVPADLAGATGTRIVLLITDGEETCGGDPAAAIRRLRRSGIDARVNIVGFALGDRKLKKRMAAWAASGGGSYFDAKGADDLARAIEQAVRAPFRVLDAAGNEVASGTVGGSPVQVPPGRYRVVVLSEPVARFDAVVVEPGRGTRLVMPVPEARVPSEGTVGGSPP